MGNLLLRRMCHLAHVLWSSATLRLLSIPAAGWSCNHHPPQVALVAGGQAHPAPYRVLPSVCSSATELCPQTGPNTLLLHKLHLTQEGCFHHIFLVRLKTL